MAALTQEIGLGERKTTRLDLPLSTGIKAWKGGTAMGRPSTGLVVKAVTGAGAAGANDIFLGVFNETIDNTAGAAAVPITVNFIKEKTILWRANDGTISAANLFNPCYFLDDQTVTLTALNHAKAGTILAVDAVKGVAFEVEGV